MTALRVNGERLWSRLMDMAEVGPGVAGGNNRQAIAAQLQRNVVRSLTVLFEQATDVSVDDLAVTAAEYVFAIALALWRRSARRAAA